VEKGVDWAVFRVDQMDFPAMCCVCLGESDRCYVDPLGLLEARVDVPICKRCQRRITMWFVLRLAVGLPLTFLAVSTSSWLIVKWAGGEAVGFCVSTIAFTLFAAFVLAAALIRLAYPYTLRVVDQSRGIWKIRFKNPVYTAIVARKIGEADGAFREGER